MLGALVFIVARDLLGALTETWLLWYGLLFVGVVLFQPEGIAAVLAETNPEEWRKIMAVNLDGPYHLSREWVPSMREHRWGRIINMCSVAMKTGGLTAGTAYTASKGALGGLTFSLARELAPHGVTVNAIAPAYVKTKMITEQLTEEQRQQTLKSIPVGRFCEPEEIAHAVVFLASPLAGFITGELLDINGGLHLD